MSAKTPRRFRLAGQTAALALVVGAIGVGTAGTAHAGDGATFHSVMIDCASTYFYRNYNPPTDDFSDPVGAPYVYGQMVNIRTGDERSGERGTRAYQNEWGWFSRMCLQGYH